MRKDGIQLQAKLLRRGNDGDSYDGRDKTTARRKVSGLVEKQILERDSQGNINFAAGLIQEGRAAKLVYEQLEAARRFMEEQVRNGVLKVR